MCEFPAGHYTYLGDVHLKNRKVFDGNSGYGLPFDPSILCDGDDIFLYYGFAFQEKKEMVIVEHSVQNLKMIC